MSWRVAAILTLIAWGALAFGAVYPWAFWPLFAGCAVLGAASFARPNAASPHAGRLALALACLLLASAAQLVPLPIPLIRSLSPETDALLRAYVVGYDMSGSHPLSIDPPATIVGLAAAFALSTFLVGLARAMNREEAIGLARGVSVVGVAIALVGIIQMPFFNGKIYGFWMPQSGRTNSFGPFVNRNHFAGWMLMALPLAMGYFCGRVARGMRMTPPGWRNRIGFFSTADANETVLIGFAVLTMAIALTLTTSRSGLLGLIVSLAVLGWFTVREGSSATRRTIVIVFSAFVLIAAVTWAGLDRLAVRFVDPTYGNRIPIWLDTLAIARRFPLTGTGLNTYSMSTRAYQTVILDVHLQEAHNDYLQIVSEGGALLAIPSVALLAVIVATIRRRFADSPRQGVEYWIRVGAVTGLVAIGVQEVGEFSLQMPGNAALFVVLLAMAMRPTSRRSEHSLGNVEHR